MGALRSGNDRACPRPTNAKNDDETCVLRHLAASRPTRGSGSMRATSCGIWAFGPSIAGSPRSNAIHVARPVLLV